MSWGALALATLGLCGACSFNLGAVPRPGADGGRDASAGDGSGGDGPHGEAGACGGPGAPCCTSGPPCDPATLICSPAQICLPCLAQMAAGSFFTCARRVDGTLSCWGANDWGQLGDGGNQDRPTPGPVSGLPGALEVAAGYEHACARGLDSSLSCWGRGDDGQLGGGVLVMGPTPTPQPVTGLGNSARQLAAGVAHTCALRNDGSVACWGLGDLGQLGNAASGAGTRSLSPVGVLAVQGSTLLTGAVEVIAEYKHACARLSGGTLACWGNDDHGQLGNGVAGTGALSARPVLVVSEPGGMPLAGVGALAAGGLRVCTHRADDSVWCWGNNDTGQLGNGMSGPGVLSAYPVEVLTAPGGPPLTGVTQLAGGSGHSCVVRADATVVCWGYNGNGELGDGSLVDRSTPVRVMGLDGVVQVVVGGAHACALRADGTLWCWGLGTSGQLGNGTMTGSPTPVQAAWACH
ncbi:MAG TPA: hypothetical protein VKN99_26330 [Polyangia bacterium]|nr:hypothetical protein [Polyangia bacterium]